MTFVININDVLMYCNMLSEEKEFRSLYLCYKKNILYSKTHLRLGLFVFLLQPLINSLCMF